MILLKIDGAKCVSCGICEAWLPGLTECIPHGGLMISESNPNVDCPAVNMAVEGCPQNALSLEVKG